MRTFSLLLAAGVLLFSAVGCDPPGKPDPKDKFVHPKKVKDPGKLFSKYCAGCHGADGKNGPAPPLNDSLFLALYTDEEILEILKKGRGEMPPFLDKEGGLLAEAQLHALIGIPIQEKDKEGKVTKETTVPGGLRNGMWGNKPANLDEKYLRKNADGGNAETGLKLFQAKCATCHGDKPESKAGPLNATDATLALMSEESLHRLIITGRPDLGMPGYDKMPGGKLSAEEVKDLWALLRQWKKTSEKTWSTGAVETTKKAK